MGFAETGQTKWFISAGSIRPTLSLLYFLTNLCRVAPPGHVLGPDSLFDAVHLLLVALAVPHGVLLGLLQGILQGFDSFGRGSKPLLQFGQLAAKVCVVSNQLRVKINFLRYFKLT